ncbi:hypothetical protein P9112_007516 [Eukaryota sp. TZLM1-RC]
MLLFGEPSLFSLLIHSSLLISGFFVIWSIFFTDILSTGIFRSLGLLALSAIIGAFKGFLGCAIPSFLFVRIWSHLGYTLSSTVVLIVASSLSAFSIFLSFKVPT